MSTTDITKGIRRQPPARAKFVGAYYLLTILTGVLVLSFHGRLAFAADLLAGVLFVILTAFFYGLSRPLKGNRGRDN